jgi:cytochrome c
VKPILRAFAYAFSASILALIVLMTGVCLLSPSTHAAGPDGKQLFEKRCTGCHDLDADHEGPHLRGVIGRPAGKVATFKYSPALEKAQFTWDETKVDQWLADTESVVPDNDMSFRVPNQEERTAIIGYLKSLSAH